MMKERPILFSGPMVRAILGGSKTQTRRVVKHQPIAGGVYKTFDESVFASRTERSVVSYFHCPYGKPGDRLWVRETWTHTGIGVWTIADARCARVGNGRVLYRATDDEPCPGCWWPSIYMPREFSRITLEITGVRVERLNAISEADAMAEGISRDAEAMALSMTTPPCCLAFSALWESINGPGSWEANPWVWVVEFRRVTGE